MEIHLGKKVISSDGKHVGHVDSLVIDDMTHDVQSIISRSGVMLTVDRIIPIEAVGQVDSDGNVHLTMQATEADQQQQFVDHAFRVANPDELNELPQSWMSVTGQMPIFFGTGNATLGYNNDSSILRSSPIDSSEMKVDSNLPEWEGLLGSGTDVVGSDGKKIGTVDDVTYSEDGKITGFMVKAGFLFHHDVRLPADWIESVVSGKVRLNVTADQAKETHDTA
ncbi:MAG TPA: PRC-barrel domain-containing protein [Nitrolancea sp.]|nr:PRC-barrel domain-containing protein [Nitrolancea sp.]